MTTRLHIVKGLLHYFYFEAEQFRSFDTIERVCKRSVLTDVGDNETRYALYDIFYPLLRWGLVEYYGNNCFRLSPSAGLFYGTKVFICHSPPGIEESLLTYRLPCHIPGISLYRYCTEVVATCKTYDIPLAKFDFYGQLLLVPTIGKLIQLWNKEEVFDTSGFHWFNENSFWVKVDGQAVLPGVYKKSEKTFAGRIIKLSQDNWKTIPERKLQFDGFGLAALFSRIQNGHELGIYYSKNLQLLTVHTSFFPVILERLLSINALLSNSSNDKVLSRNYHLDGKGFTILNKIFHNSIKLK